MNSSKIAILLLAHKNPKQLEELVHHFAKDFDVYVHIDQKSNIELPTQFENVHIYSKFEVYWGSYTQILASLFLLEQAKQTNYQRYIFLSGTDLPIKSNNSIQEFFENNKFEYLEWEKLPRKVWAKRYNGGLDRLSCYWDNRVGDSTEFQISDLVFVPIRFLQRLFGWKRNVPIELYGGANWISITNDAVDYIFKFLDDNPWYLKMFKHSECGDELFFQTILCNSEFKNTTKNQLLHYLEWEENAAHPKTLRESDIPKLIKSDKLFARKFEYNEGNISIFKNIT